VKWYRLSAQQGYAPAQSQLGNMYDRGDGVSQNYLHAYMWSSLAASKLASDVGPGGNLKMLATVSRDDSAKNLTPAGVLRAQAMAKQCEESNYKQCDEPEDNLAGYASTPVQTKREGNQANSSAASVPMKREGGTYVVPVLINGAITLNFVIDSGAADVSIPADVVMTLKRTGTLTEADFQGEQTYKLADGSTIPSQTFRIRSLKVGDRIVENVLGSIASEKSSPLLGQSFFSRFKSWSVDNTKHALVLE